MKKMEKKILHRNHVVPYCPQQKKELDENYKTPDATDTHYTRGP